MSLSLCTHCFSLSDLSKQTSQRCRCEEQIPINLGMLDCPSGLHFCYICARAVAGGFGRYSWNACKSCLGVNSGMAEWLGVSVPLGRHSIMNGIGISMSATRPEFEDGATALIAFSQKSVELSDWGHLQTRALLESVPAWADRKVITVIEWEKKFKASKKNSRDDFAAYYGVDELWQVLMRRV